jgi:hypothetical protein
MCSTHTLHVQLLFYGERASGALPVAMLPGHGLVEEAF